MSISTIFPREIVKPVTDTGFPPETVTSPTAPLTSAKFWLGVGSEPGEAERLPGHRRCPPPRPGRPGAAPRRRHATRRQDPGPPLVRRSHSCGRRRGRRRQVPAGRRDRGQSPGLAVQLGHPPHHLLRSHVLHVRRDGPPVPEGVHHVAVPVAVELGFRRAPQLRAKLHRSCDDGIHVLDIDEQRRRRAGQATGRRCLGPPLRVLILDDDDRVPDLDFGVGDGPIRAREAHALGRAEHRTVDLQGLPAPLNGETGRDPAVRIRDRAGPCCRCHRLPPWWYARPAPGPCGHDAKRIWGSSRPPSTSTTIGGARDPTIPGKRWPSRNILPGVLAGGGALLVPLAIFLPWYRDAYGGILSAW